MRRHWDTQSITKEIREKLGDKVIIPDDFRYANIDKIHNFICPIHGVFAKSCYRLLTAKYPCHWCAPNKKKSWKELKELFNIIHNFKYNYDQAEKEYRPKCKLKIYCSEHGVFEQTVASHLKGQGCSQCYSDKKNISINKFIFDCISIHGDSYNYRFIFDDYFNTKSKLRILCKEHGEFIQLAGDHRNGSGCPKCKESKGERSIRLFLEKNAIEYESQKTFDKCISEKSGKYKFDFFLPKLNILIEYDGVQHFKSIENKFDLNEIKESDYHKTKFANENNIKLIRIKYSENIEMRLKNELKVS